MVKRMKKNYIDEKGNYINAENLSLAEIYNRGREEGYKKGFIDGTLNRGGFIKEVNVSDVADDCFKKLMGGDFD